MSQLKMLEQVTFTNESESIFEQYIEEKSVYKMNITEVEKALVELKKKKVDLEAKKKWWNSLSSSEKQKESNKSKIWSVIIVLFTPTLIVGGIPTPIGPIIGLTMHKKYIDNPKNLSANAWSNMDAELEKVETKINKGISDLEQRKKDLSSSKNESSILSKVIIK